MRKRNDGKVFLFFGFRLVGISVFTRCAAHVFVVPFSRTYVSLHRLTHEHVQHER